MKVRAFYPVTLQVDGEEIDLRIKRMTFEEHQEFMARMTKFGTPTYQRFVSRGTSEKEQERNAEGHYTIPFEELAKTKIAELSPENRAEYEKAQEEDEAEGKEFLIYAFERFATVGKGLIEELPDGSEKSVSTGLDLLRIFGARADVIQNVLDAIWKENMLDASQKKALLSPTGSSPSSAGQDQVQAGPKQKTIASPVVTEDFADNGDATKSPQDPSGSTDPSPLDPVPSSH